MLKLLLSLTHICDSHWAFSKSINKQMFTDELLNSMGFVNTVRNKEKTPAQHLTHFILSNSNCVQFLFELYRITATFKLRTIYTWRRKFSLRHGWWEDDWLKIQLPILPKTLKFFYPLELTLSATVHSTNRSAHPITAQYIVLCYGLTDGHLFQLCCDFGYQWCCITAGW